jgi:hypothetical protein
LLLVTATLLVAGLALIAPSLVGLAASLPLGLLLTGVAGGLYAFRDDLASVGVVAGVHLGTYLAVLWTGPLVAALVVLLSLDATAGELQALGGLAGLFGMVNYFLRPVYAAIVAVGRRLQRTLS